MALRDGVDVGILGLLVGAELPLGIRRHRQLAASVLGTGIGALVDAGLTDGQITDLCATLLGKIREAMSTPDPMTALADIIRSKGG